MTEREHCPTCLSRNKCERFQVNNGHPVDCWLDCPDPWHTSSDPRPTLDELLEKTRHHVMTPEEKEAQRQSWVKGEMGLDRGDDGFGKTMPFKLVAPAEPQPPQMTDLEDKISIAKLNHSRWIQVETAALDILVRLCRAQAEKLAGGQGAQPGGEPPEGSMFAKRIAHYKERAEKAEAQVGELSERVRQLERALQWVLDNRLAHPANIARVAEEALETSKPIVGSRTHPTGLSRSDPSAENKGVGTVGEQKEPQ